jgi:hypothetical protein
MASDEAHGSGEPGGDRPEHRDQPASTGPGPVTCRLVLELTLADEEPLSGTIGPPGGPAPLAFKGWIDLMSAIGTLRADATRARPASS